MQQNAFTALRLPAALNDTIANQAERYGKSKSALIRQILEAYLNAMKGST